MKKIIAVILIISFGLMVPLKPLVLSVYQQFWKLHIYQLIKSEIKTHHLTEFTFSKNDLKSGKIKLEFVKAHEFRYNGMMFDIKSKKYSGDSVTYLCFRDIKESILIASIRSSFANSGNFEQTLPNELMKLLKSHIFDNYTLLLTNINRVNTNSAKILIVLLKYISAITEIQTPPPKNISL